MVAAPDVPQGVNLAGFGVRVVAYLVDAFLLSFVGGAFPYIVLNTGNANIPGGRAVTATSLLVSFVYFVLFWSDIGGGRTPGGRVAVLEAIVRWIGLWLSFVFCFLGVIWVAIDDRKQGWHDKMAHTFVVHA